MAKLRSVLKLAPGATNAQINEALDAFAAQNNSEDEQPQGEQAPAPSANAEAPAPAAEAAEEAPAPEAAESNADGSILAAIQGLQTAMNDKFAALDTRLQAVEEQPAGTTTNGAAEAADLGGANDLDAQIMALPINQKYRKK